jgi:hypothetical protein
MGNPFEAFTRASSSEPAERIILLCKKCGENIARTDLPSRQWVHVDDELTIAPSGHRSAGLPLFVNQSQYDHDAEPDCIDIDPIYDSWEKGNSDAHRLALE